VQRSPASRTLLDYVPTVKTCIACGEENPDKARFCMVCATSLEPAGRHERRVVTILFADMKGSTEIGERLDAEAVRSVLTRFYAASRAVLERHGGTVEKFIGDAVKAVYGVPRSREDDPLRAVRAAADLRDAVARMNAELRDRVGVEIQIRTGVNTGEVVAGDTWVDASFVAGDAVNVTARLEAAAPPGEVLLGELTYRAVREFVEVEAVEPLTLKGKAEPVPAYRLVRVLAPGVRTHPVAPMVGREDELEAVLAGLRRSGGTDVVPLPFVVGDPGIGKSRLLEELAIALENDAVVVRTSPDDARGAARSWPAGLALRALAGLGPDDDDERAVEAFTALLPERDQAPAIARVAADIVRGAVADDPAEERWALEQLVTGGERPLVLVLDDLDEGTDEEMESLSGLVTLKSMGIAAAGRSGEDERLVTLAGAAGRPVRTVWLGPLDDASMGVLAEHLVGATVPSALSERLLAAASGNPLYLTETVRMLLDEGAIRLVDGVVEVAAGGTELPMPTTIRGVLQSRLDALAQDERAMLECAAVLGPASEGDALIALAAGEGLQRPADVIDALVDRGLLIEARGSPPRLLFHHALLRSAAYDAITKEGRARLHERAADELERRDEAEGAGTHLETALRLRTSISLPGEGERAMATRAAELLARAGMSRLDSGDQDAGVALLDRATHALTISSGEASVPNVVELAFRLGRWDGVIDLLGNDADPDDSRSKKRLGIALTKGRRDDPNAIARGRRLLEEAAEADADPDAFASLAGTWKGTDDDRAKTLYARAVALDAADPYALGNLLEYEVAERGDVSAIEDRRSDLEAAIGRRAAQVRGGEDMPWCWYDLGKFRLMAGRPYDAARAYAGGVLTSGASFMLTTNLTSLERLRDLGLEGWAWCSRILALGLASRFPDEGAVAGSRLDLHGIPIVLAGSSSRASEPALRDLRRAFLETTREIAATLVSGGTRQGIGAIAGEAAAASAAIPAVGYLPKTVPTDVEIDERYAEIRRTDGETFSPLEPLAYWADLLASGVSPREVRVIGASGGEISGFEFRLALALGARVAGITGSGGEIARLLRDPRWTANGRLVEVAPEPEALRRFLIDA
jgi:class 3 adenylate cyclase